ncbi:MAG TPA: rRNA maturation RNAse YbeY [Gemmatimonadales bacterium]|nr:rRNA maturation RNAse YbeY [Gemmatimonadales bacterium]
MDAARRVLRWERAGGRRVRLELTLLDAAAMRRLNHRAFGRRALTDVIAFALPQPDGGLLGDVYICPEAARHWVENVARSTSHVARNGRRGRDNVDHATWNVELLRLAVHGTLHVLGYDHPEGPARTRSAMWRRQERYVRRLARTVR